MTNTQPELPLGTLAEFILGLTEMATDDCTLTFSVGWGVCVCENHGGFPENIRNFRIPNEELLPLILSLSLCG